MMSRIKWIAVTLSATALGAGLAGARGAEVRLFRTESKSAFAEGTADSVSVGEYGELILGRATDEIAVLEQPYVYQAVAHGDGWIIGSGSDGVVLRIGVDGSVTELPPLAEEHVFAVAAGDDGSIWAGSSPSGQLYRWEGASWISYDIHREEDLYIWALEPFDGGVYVATGARGRVLKVTADGEVEDLVGELDAHVRSLHLLDDGSLLAGTEGMGTIVHIDGAAGRVLHVAAVPEITALADDGAGTCYAAAVKSPATLVAGAAQQAASTSTTGTSGNGTATATITVSAGSRSADAAAATTILRFRCHGGVVETLAEWEGETAYDLAFYDGDLWVGTGQEGKIYRFDDSGTRFLEQDLEESQVVSLMVAKGALTIASSNAGKLLVSAGGDAEEGEFESVVFDTELLSRVGALSWVGDGSVEFAVRSGQTGTPDDGWSAWSEWRQGQSIDFADVAGGRFLQWRARLRGGARVNRVTLAYRQHNVGPRISQVEVLAPGEVLVDSSFNPGQQVFEPARPAHDGIFTTLKPSSEKNAEKTKTLWKAGARSLKWSAEDGNDDELRYRVEVRPEGGDWMLIDEDLEADYLTIDATVLPDGAYRFRVTVDDGESNDEAEALEHSAITPLVFLDQTPPVLGKVSEHDGRLQIVVEDSHSVLQSIEVSRDGEEWQPATVADGSVDEMTEIVLVEITEERGLLIVRATDRSHNHSVHSVP